MRDSSPPSSSTRPSRSRRDFQRVYKACESCRRKKSRCILDSGSPMGHPCARCRRELRECVFSEDRSTQRKPTAAKQKESFTSRKDNIHVAVLPRSVNDDANQSRQQTVVNDLVSTNALAPAMTVSPGANDTGALPSPGSTFQQPSRAADSGFGNSPNPGRLADTVMRTVVSSENDALNLLFQAAEQSHNGNNANSVLDPEKAARLHEYTTPSSRVADSIDLSLPGTDVLRVWGAFRFTKMGWLTTQEAVTYMDLFFANLAPLTPVIDQHYANHDNHFSLITQEPLLCCTILLISSRYHILPGTGSTFRAILLHQRLWEHCQHLVSRITFGQEKKSKAKTRTVGSILALLLLTEWHPWAIHFPPAADGWDSDLLLSMSDHRDQPGSNTADDIDDTHARWLGDVARPAKMSDRMSWMLIGCAMSLAHELGVCDATPDVDSVRGDNRHAFEAFEPRRIGKLLYIFAEQLSWRLGCASMISTNLSQSASEPISVPRDASALDSLVLNAWIELTTLTRAISDALFPSTVVTRQLLLSGRHVNIIKHFQQQLVRWRVAHLDSHGMNEIFQETLTIEYQYLLVFMNSLGMQAVCDRVSGDAAWGHSAAPLHTSITPTDYEFIRAVIDGTCEILESVCRLADAGRLRYSTIRVIMRVIAASIFLLKALSLGAWTAQLERSLSILERSIQALRNSALDDMHLAARYAALLDLHVARFRDGFVASTVPQGLPPAELDIGLRDAETTGVLENMGHDSFQLSDDWLSMPFDISMAPFGVTGDTEELLGLDHGNWNFLWNLPLV